MLTDPLREAVNECLFSAEDYQAYAIIDGASLPGLIAQIESYPTEYCCLFLGKLHPALAAAAPYLIKLQQYSHTMEWLLNSWGQHIGIFALAKKERDFNTVRKHFRGFLRITGSDDKPAFLRYYDPRFLRRYLPTCDKNQIQTVFGSVIHTYIAEGKDPRSIMRYWVNADTVESKNILYPDLDDQHLTQSDARQS